MIKALTANKNPFNFKELEHLKWQTTHLQHMLRMNSAIVQQCGGQHSYCYSYCSCCERALRVPPKLHQWHGSVRFTVLEPRFGSVRFGSVWG